MFKNINFKSLLIYDFGPASLDHLPTRFHFFKNINRYCITYYVLLIIHDMFLK